MASSSCVASGGFESVATSEKVEGVGKVLDQRAPATNVKRPRSTEYRQCKKKIIMG